ncbi:unnamed protein product [Coccothraustes coccothraustes]
MPCLCPPKHAECTAGTYIRTLPLPGAHVSYQSAPASLQSVLNKTGSEVGRTRRFRPVLAGEFGRRFVQARVCGAALAARGPRAVRRRGAAAVPAGGLRAGPRPQPAPCYPSDPGCRSGTRHPAPGLRCGVAVRGPAEAPEIESRARRGAH